VNLKALRVKAAAEVVVRVVVKAAVKLAQKVVQVAHAMALPLHVGVVLHQALAVIAKTVRKEALMAHPQIVSTIAVIVAMTGRMTEAWTAVTIAPPAAMSCPVTSTRS
jgi:hypothetical protein